MHQVAPARQNAYHAPRVVPVRRLAENRAVHVHHRIAADDHILRAALRHGAAFGSGQLLCQKRGRFGTDGPFVHVAGAHRVIRCDKRHQLPAAGRR